MMSGSEVSFFFQAEDGIRDSPVTGVQTWCSSDLKGKYIGINFFKIAFNILNRIISEQY